MRTLFQTYRLLLNHHNKDIKNNVNINIRNNSYYGKRIYLILCCNTLDIMLQ